MSGRAQFAATFSFAAPHPPFVQGQPGAGAAARGLCAQHAIFANIRFGKQSNLFNANL
jgi:hypothetical protein